MSNTDLTRHDGGSNLPEKMNYAKALASANLLPRAYQNNPGNVLLAMELGDALGVPPVQAINGIHVIEGKPSASADLIASLVRKAGHKLRVTGDDRSATAQIIRADDPDFTYEVTWTMDRAKAAGLTGKGVWKSYPAAMLKARAITEVARAGASDALYGVIYTPEEIGADVGGDGRPAERPQEAAAPRSGNARLADAVRAHTPPAEDIVDAEVDPDPVDVTDAPEAPAPVPEKAARRMFALLGELGINDRDKYLKLASWHTRRDLTSTSEMTAAEVSAFIDYLQGRVNQQPPADEPTDDGQGALDWPDVQEPGA